MNYFSILEKEMRRPGAPILSVLVFMEMFWILGPKINASKSGKCTSLAQVSLLQRFAAFVFIISNRY